MDKVKELKYKSIDDKTRSEAFERIRDLDTLLDAFMTMGNYEKQHSIGVRDKTALVLSNIQKHKPELLPKDININDVILAAWFHDIGKLMIPSSVLDKNGKLTDQEFTEIKNHAFYTEVALNKVLEFHGKSNLIKTAATHHEALNGSGYPYRLTDKDITFGAKLLRIVDCYDALRMNRQYRVGMNINDTINILNSDLKNQKIDADIFSFFCSIIPDIEKLSSLKIEENKESYVFELQYLLKGGNLMSYDTKFYYPDVGLDDAKTAEDHFKDLRYYIQDGNIPAIEKIEEICGWMKMPFEVDICKFAKQSVEIDNEGKMPYNIADIKKDVAEALRDDGFYFGEVEFTENGRNSSIHINAHASEDSKSLDNAEVSIMLFEMTGIGTEKERESFGASRISFGEFKEMPAHGFNIEHKSFDSLLNEIRAYSDTFDKTDAWKPSVKEEKSNTKEKDLNFGR